MPDPREVKIARELGQVRAFLEGRSIEFAGVERGPDPPDVVVSREGMSSLAVEIIEYHPEVGRVGIQNRWEQLRVVLEGLMRERPRLKGISINPRFRDPKVPVLRHHQMLAERIIQCVETLLDRGWIGNGIEEITFASNTPQSTYLKYSSHGIVVSANEWPQLSEYVDVIYFTFFPCDYYVPCNNYHVQSVWIPDPTEKLWLIIEQKNKKMSETIHRGRYSIEGPLWLLIVYDNSNDYASWIPQSERLDEIMNKNKDDHLLFDRVWLLNASTGVSQCLIP